MAVPAHPRADRPYMPGYGLLPADQGTGLLSWADAERRLTASHDYWVASVYPDGRPHVTPVWGVWRGGSVWFSCSLGSRKARNLRADPRCTVTTDDAIDPVVVEGAAERTTADEDLAAFATAVNEKYDEHMTVEFLDPAVNAVFVVRPHRAFALNHDDFTGSPTRWRFDR